MLKIKRVYEGFDKSDGYRVLVDRIWPRGVSKEKAHLDLWLKEIGPSDTLRKWFSHDPKKWAEFKKRYKEELKLKDQEVKQLKDLVKSQKTVTMLYGARDETHNQAVVLQEYLNS